MLSKSPPNEDYALNNAYWIMHLSNGEVFYENSYSWLEMKNYLQENNLRVNKVIFKFRSNEIHFNIKEDVEYIYYSKSVGKDWNDERQDSFYVFGYQNSPNTIEKVWYRVPELIKFKEETISLDSPKAIPDFIYKMPLVK